MIRDPQAAHAVHFVFEWMAILIGFQTYRVLKRRQENTDILAPSSFAVVIGCIAGAAIGNKLVFWLEHPQLFVTHAGNPVAWFMGQSIVGGLLGGLIGVEVAKKLTGQQKSTGDLFVFPLLLGIAIGRIGCFLAGLNDGTFGVATNLPWGVDFGDGVARHPTQLYEMLFLGALAIVLRQVKPHLAQQSGLLFKCFLTAYLCWRLWVDGIKPVPYAYPFGLSGIQWICIIALAAYLPFGLKQFSRLKATA